MKAMKVMRVYEHGDVEDLKDLKTLFDKGFNRACRGGISSSARRFLNGFSNVMDMLVDFSERFTGYDMSLPCAFQEIVCKDDKEEFEKRRAAVKDLEQRFFENRNNKLDFTRISCQEYCSGDWSLMYSILCDFIVLRTTSVYKQNVSSLRRTLKVQDMQTREVVLNKSAPLGDLYPMMMYPMVKDKLSLTTKSQVSSTAKEKENHMADASTVAILKELAKTPDAKDDLTSLTSGISPDLDKALAELQAEKNSSKAKREAKVIMDIQERCETVISHQVEAIRSIRRQEKESLKALATITRAKAYAAETKNFIPLLYLIDGYVPNVSPKDCEVPEGWKPKSEATEQ